MRLLINILFSAPLEQRGDISGFCVLISMRDYYVYLLECDDGTYYVGVTNDLTRRIMEHQEGFDQSCYTYDRRSVVLKQYLTFKYIHEAIEVEKKLKKWSRAKKLAYFQKDIATLHEKAACRNETSHKNRSSGAET